MSLDVEIDANLKNNISQQRGCDCMLKSENFPHATKELYFKSDFRRLRKGKIQF
jgi:hypothetical protein